MNMDATFWVAVSFFIFVGGLIYLKIPQKINLSLEQKIDEIKKEIEEAEKLKEEAKNLLNDHQNKINKAQGESKKLIDLAKKEGEKIIIKNNEKFYSFTEIKKMSTKQKITQMKEEAIRNIKETSIKITINSVENLIKNSIDKSKLEKIYKENLEQAKLAIKKSIQ